MQTTDFDYHLPPDLIAQQPTARRDASRLLVVERATQRLRHHVFSDLPDLLAAGDLLVVNDSRVRPARLRGTRVPGGGAAELLLLRQLEPETWLCLARPARRLRPGTQVEFGQGRLHGTVWDALEEGQRVVRFAAGDRPLDDVIAALGELPLPPYIHAYPDDPERYQTVYARDPGSIAAPTAGLHFTPELLEALAQKGIQTASVTLHVGLGTFKPVQTDVVAEHRMHAEYGVLPVQTAAAIAATRRAGHRVVAVGTTAVRVLESVALAGQREGWSGWTEIFIYPGFQFQQCDALVTNFHLPRSTLLMLVSAFADKSLIDAAYREAIAHRYRFYSFGDAMLIL
jgi:S-adenosylmethionine:tRNA ribosyltransferase-isomerase